MNKQSVVLPGSAGMWGSYVSKYQPDSSKVLDNMFTAGSKNFVTDQTGMIQKRQGGIQWNRTSFSEAAKDTYEAVFENGARHFLRVGGGVLSASTGTGLFDTITSGYSPLGNFEWVTYQNRVYGCNGINPPQTYDIATSYGGVNYSFTTGKTKAMGAQAPTSAPTAGIPTSGGNVPLGPHRYKITFVYYDAEESNGSISSDVQTTTPGVQTITLTNIPVGGYGVTARNIYRDNDDGNFLLLDTIPNNLSTSTTYVDVLPIGSTPTPIPAFNDPPPTFSKCALWLDSIFIAPSGETNVVRYSNAGSPNIFEPDNYITCQSDDVITALYVYNGKLYVFGLHSFGSIEGNTPDTFYYHNISNLIGCVDNRSIQIRSIVSVPTLWWLSDKGLYYSNGNTVEYGSDLIQDLVNLNIAQVNYSTNKNTQTSDSDFAGDNRTPGIQIGTDPEGISGAVTTVNPTKQFSTTVDWNTGSSITNCRTSNGNFLEVVTRYLPVLTSGVLTGGAQISGSNVQLQTTAPFTGETSTYFTRQTTQNGFQNKVIAVPIIPQTTGTLTYWSFVGEPEYLIQYSELENPAYFLVRWHLYYDGFGQPGNDLYVGPWISASSFSTTLGTVSYPMTAGIRYWIGMELHPNAGYWKGIPVRRHPNPVIPGPYQASGGWSQKRGFDNVWRTLTTAEAGGSVALPYQYNYTTTPIPSTGTWTSPVYDSGSTTAVSTSLVLTGSYPSSTSGTAYVYASASSNMSNPVSQSFSNPTGINTLSLSGYRYWQIVYNLSTSTTVVTPVMSVPTLNFSTTATWISDHIDTTTDNTAWGIPSFTGNAPLGTTVTLTIATSDNPDITPTSSFVPTGSALVKRYAKIKAVLTSTSDNITSPSVSSITLNWAITATITSSIIDSGTDPAGFNTVQWEQIDPNVGTISFYIRTAATSGAIATAPWILAANGEFPNLTALRFMQWKVVLGALPNLRPVITSVTISWFMSVGTVGVRCASIFYNKTYYLSVATIGSPVNDTLIQLDQFGNWRIQKDTSIGTFLSYFNTLYFTDGINGNIFNGFIADTDNGTAISMDVRTKAWSAENDLFLKVPRALKVTGIHTGTKIRAFYSTDRGNTWIEMLNENGTLGYQTNSTKTAFTVLFVPDALTLTAGRTLMYRLTSSDIYPCSIINYVPSFYSRYGRYLNNG